MEDRKKALEILARKLKYKDDPSTARHILAELPLGSQALQARNLTEEALAHQVLKNTGVPIPGNNASLSKKEDFLNRILNEVYPEFEGNPNLRIDPDIDPNVHGTYNSVFQSIKLNPDSNKDITKSLATSLHEAGHAYDDRILGYRPPQEMLKGHPTQLNIKKMYQTAADAADEIDPTQLYEIAAKGHHARIPGVRDADSFGLGALKSFMKSGTFRGIAPVLAKGAVATAGGLASLASEASDSEDAGSSSEQAAFLRERDEMVRRGDNYKDASPIEKSAFDKMYEELDAGKAFNARRDALRRMSGK